MCVGSSPILGISDKIYLSGSSRVVDAVDCKSIAFRHVGSNPIFRNFTYMKNQKQS